MDRLALIAKLSEASFQRDNVANPKLAEYVLDRTAEGRAERRGEPLMFRCSRQPGSNKFARAVERALSSGGRASEYRKAGLNAGRHDQTEGG